MRIVAAFVAFLAFWSLSQGFSWSALIWFILGIALCFAGEIIEYLERTQRFIHRDKR
jgi:hypothetical protein